MYGRIKDFDIVDPSSLAIAKKESFVESLYQLHSKIFEGVEKQDFIAYVVESPAAEWTRIRIYKNNMDEWVGYCAAHRFKVNVFNQPCVIMRAEAGILREYRGRSKTLWFGFSQAMSYRMRHPFCALYYLGCFVHPSVSYMFSRYFGEYYPRADAPIPAQIKDFLSELAGIFHLEAVAGRDVLVRKVGWITKESAKDRSFWQNHTHPMVKFYLKTNPGYIGGDGPLMLVPLTFRNIIISLVKYLSNKIRKYFFP